MCRFAAYVGAPRAVADLVYLPEHGLERQAHAPRQQQHGTMNVDGTGVAWWPDGETRPRRYASTAPPWADDNLRQLAPVLRGRAIVAAVRGATPGVPHGRGAVAPFVIDGLAIAHNGWIGAYPGPVAERLLGTLPAARVAGLEVLTDSTLVAAAIAEAHTTEPDLLAAVRAGLDQVAAAVRTVSQAATLNVVVGDGTRVVGARTSVALPGNSLHVCPAGSARWADGALLASEPLDDGPWEPVGDDTLVEVRPEGHRLAPLDLDLSAIA